MYLSLKTTSKFSSWIAGVITFSSVLLPQIFFSNPIALAQIGASPLVIQVQAQRGKAQGIISVRNTTNEPTRVRIYTEPFTYEREQGFQILEQSEQNLAPYLRFSPREMTIPPQSERRVRLLTQFPPSLPDGEYRAVVFAESLTESRDAQQNLVGIVARIGTTVYVRKGDLQPNLAVENIFYDQKEQKIKVLVSNSGQASALPELTWKITQNGKLVAEGETPETTVIREGERVLQISPTIEDENGVPKPLPLKSGNYQLSGELIWQIDDKNPNIVPFKTNLSVSN